MARKHVQPEAKPSSSLKPILLVGVGVVVLVAFAVLLFWSDIQLSLTINKLHSDDPRVRKAAREELATSTASGLDEKLAEILVDPDKAFNVRTQVGAVLLRRSRMTYVERAMTSDDLDARVAALAVFNGHQHVLPDGGRLWFERDVAGNPAYRVEETLLAWLARDGDLSRLEAVGIARDLRLETSIPLLRALAIPPRSGTLSRPERGIVSAAANALVSLKDCESIPPLLAAANASDDDRLRLRLMQLVYRAVAGAQPACEGAVPEDDVKAMVIAALDSAAEVKQGALLIFAEKPDWGREVSDRMLAILDGVEEDNVYVRRGALSALTAIGDEAFGRRLPRYFHADDLNLRSQAVSGSRAYARKPGFEKFFESCWIGVLSDETESSLAFDSAVGGLRDRAGVVVGMPPAVLGKSEGRVQRTIQFRKEMFEKGESFGLDRLEWIEVWFAWWAKKLGIEPVETRNAAFTARRAFWEAARAGDVARAEQVLESVPSGSGLLFTYEQGWLESR